MEKLLILYTLMILLIISCDLLKNDNDVRNTLDKYLQRGCFTNTSSASPPGFESKESDESNEKKALIQKIKKAIEKDGNEANLNHINVSDVIDMSGLFAKDIPRTPLVEGYNLHNFDGDISKWNVSNVEDMTKMFAISKFSGDISDWKVENVKNMRSMFLCNRFFSSDIAKWDVSNVEDMRYMFIGTNSFNYDISKWDIRKVTNMRGMFGRNTGFNQDLSAWGEKLNPLIKERNFYRAISMFIDSAVNPIPKWCTGFCAN